MGPRHDHDNKRRCRCFLGQVKAPSFPSRPLKIRSQKSPAGVHRPPLTDMRCSGGRFCDCVVAVDAIGALKSWWTWLSGLGKAGGGKGPMPWPPISPLLISGSSPVDRRDRLGRPQARSSVAGPTPWRSSSRRCSSPAVGPRETPHTSYGDLGARTLSPPLRSHPLIPKPSVHQGWS